VKKQLTLLTILLTLGGSSLWAKVVPISDKELKNIQSSYKTLQDPTLTLLEGIDEGDTYVVKLEYKKKTYAKIMYAFINKKAKHLYVGTRYNQDGSLSEYPKTDDAIKKIKEGVFFSFGSGKKEIYMVTDPDCRYCKKFEHASEGKMSDYRVHVIFHPFEFHEKSAKMVAWIMEGKDEKERRNRMEEVMLKGSKAYDSATLSEALKAQIKKGHTASQALGAIGSPLFYDAHFNPLSKREILSPQK